MRALLVKGGEILEVGLDDNDTLKHMQELVETDCICSGGWPDNYHMAWVDDNGMLRQHAKQHLHAVSWYPHPLIGNILVTGVSREGDTLAATMTVHELHKKVVLSCTREGEKLGGSLNGLR